MCDLTEIIYSPNDVVWVKLGPVWWPGRVCGEDEIPPEIMKDLRKTPIAIVKFFQEESFEYVKSLSNIYHYHCPRKNEFIKKGLDMLRSKNRGAPSNMKLFPEDIVRAECLTNGNPAILQNNVFLPEEKPAYTDLFATNKKTPKKIKPDVKKKQATVKPNTPRLITHPRFLQLSSGQGTDYEVRERKQEPVRAECDVEDTTPPTSYHCTECDYTTTRLNVMVWHNKSHIRNYASPQVSGKLTKRKSTASVKLKERSSTGSPNVECRADDTEGVSAAKIPKTNGTLKARSPKTPGRKKSTTTAKKATPQNTPDAKETNSTTSARVPAQKLRRSSAPKSDEFHKSLLEDWLEDEMEQEFEGESTAEENSPGSEATNENAVLVGDGSALSNDLKSKSCFDFDDSEDHLVIDKSKFKLGRKIPHLLNKSATSSTLAPDDVVAIPNSTDAMEVDTTTADSTPKYQSGVEDGMDGESALSQSQTSQLQEMGVDNEIEIKTEETPVSKVVIESVPPKKSRRNLKTEVKVEDATELQDKVDKLLNEISKVPAKLPDIPRSHKKAQLKAYYQQAEAEEQAAQKAAAEAEIARKAVAEAEAAQNAITEVVAANKVATKAETAQRVVAKAEAAQNTATEVLPVQKAAAEAKAALNVVPEAEAAQGVAAEAETTQKVAAVAAKAENLSVQQKVAAEFAYENLNPETMDIEVSSIPLPSPQKHPVTSEPVESSINFAISATVPECETSAAQLSTTTTDSAASLVQTCDEMLVAENAAAGSETVVTDAKPSNSVVVDQKTTATASDELSLQTPPCLTTSEEDFTETSAMPAKADAKTPSKLTTPSKVKPINATSLLRSGQQTLKIISQSDYKLLMNKFNASAGQVSPSKTSSSEPLKTIKTTIKTASGKSFLCNLTTQSPKVLLANSQCSNSPTKILILTNYKKSASPAPAAATTATATTTPTPPGRSIDLANNATTVHLTPNILQKTAAQKAAAALAKTTGKNIVLDASTFQSLFQPQPCKFQSPMVLPEVPADSTPQAPSSAAVSAMSSQSGIVYMAEGGAQMASSNSSCPNAVSSSTAGQTVDFNYIVDSSGNLVQIDEPNLMTPTKDKDILAKALENTDGLQTEMALSDATNSVLDSCSVAQNTEMAYKTEAIYENLTLNTAPIMSAYETPSRTVATANILPETTNEMVMVQSAVESSGYII